MRPGEWPELPPVWIYKQHPHVFIDYPADLQGIDVVSDPLRRFLEAEAPGAAEYLPIRFEGPGGDEIPHRYWAVNFLREFDCLDEETSMNTHPDGTPYVEVPVIDPRRIPEDGVLGILKGFIPICLMRNDLRLKVKKAGFTGFDFFDVAHVTTPTDLNFRKVNWSDPDGVSPPERKRTKPATVNPNALSPRSKPDPKKATPKPTAKKTKKRGSN